MTRPRRLAFAFTLIITACFAPLAAAQQPAPPVVRWLPADTLAMVEIARPQDVIDFAANSPAVAAASSSPQFQQARNSPEVNRLRRGVVIFEQIMDADWNTALNTLAAGGMTVAILGPDQAVLITEARDAAALAAMHDRIQMLARTFATRQGAAGQILRSYEHAGVTCWSFGGFAAHAIIGNRFVLATRSDVLERIVDMRSAAAGSLGDTAEYKAARATAAASPAARAYVNMTALRGQPGIERAIAAGRRNPGATLLLSPILQMFADARWMAMNIDIAGDALKIAAVTDPPRPSPAGDDLYAFATPPAGGGAPPNLDVPGRLAAVSLHRDLHQFYAAKEQLFPERTSGLIFFENMMGIFFTGRDITDEVFGELHPDIQLVVASQPAAWPADVPAPSVKLPAFALVFTMKSPERFGLMAEEAWQKALGMVNFTRGQQALSGLLIDKPAHAGVKYTMAAFSPVSGSVAPDSDLRFNFRPCIARVGDKLILSSTDMLTNDLIDALKTPGPDRPAAAGQHTAIDLDARQIGQILLASRDLLVRSNMIEKGHTQPQAEAEVDVFVGIVQSLGHVSLTAGSSERGRQVTLEIHP